MREVRTVYEVQDSSGKVNRYYQLIDAKDGREYDALCKLMAIKNLYIALHSEKGWVSIDENGDIVNVGLSPVCKHVNDYTNVYVYLDEMDNVLCVGKKVKGSKVIDV